jgi:3-methyladenine DNA glycosylase AlkD
MDTIRKRLFALAEENYRQFHSRLCPNTDNILGVRVPLLRNLAKEIAKGDWRTYLASAQNDYYEEVLLQGLVIGTVKADIEEILRYAADFIPKIDNWAICDGFCASLKITKKNPARVQTFLEPYLASTQEFELRFAIVMLLDFYISEESIDQVLLALDKIKHNGYYVKMAIAWAISICYIKYPEKTMHYLKHNTLDDFTYNKALQKITESIRITKEKKVLIRSMKR